MSQSIFPTLITNTFIPSLWRFPSGQITAEYLNTNFLKFPVAQGSETIPLNLTIGGLTTTNDLRLDNTTIHIGTNAGSTNQGDFAYAVGFQAGQSNQETGAVAVGSSAGETSQGQNSVAVGNQAGILNLGDNSIAIGNGSVGTGENSIAIGYAANTSTFTTSVAIGTSALSTANNQITLGTVLETVRVPGATTATGLITANGGLTMGGSNNITLGSGATAPTAGQLGYTVSNGAGLSTITSSYQTYGSLTLDAGVYIFISRINMFSFTAASTVDFDILNNTTSTYYLRTAFSTSTSQEYQPIVPTIGRVTGASQTIIFRGKTRGNSATVTVSSDYTGLSAIKIA
jgi:hypothetical protein